MPRTPPRLEPIHANERFAAAASILRTLEEGQHRVEQEIDALRIEEYLVRKPSDSRAARARERLAKTRAAAPQDAGPAGSDKALPASVVAALELLRGTRQTRRVDRSVAIAQLEDDRDLIREGIFAQQAIVDAIRTELSSEMAARQKPAHRDLVLAQYRAAQALAAATDAEREFRRAVTEAGYGWFDDRLPAPALRSALLLGSELSWDSEISRTRRLLEGWGML